MKKIILVTCFVLSSVCLYSQTREDLNSFFSSLSGKWTPNNEWTGAMYDFTLVWDGKDVYFSYTSKSNFVNGKRTYSFSTDKAKWIDNKLILSYRSVAVDIDLISNVTIEIPYQPNTSGVIMATVSSTYEEPNKRVFFKH